MLEKLNYIIYESIFVRDYLLSICFGFSFTLLRTNISLTYNNIYCVYNASMQFIL